ncbi:putative quinol monooxygenase [Paraburkholderia sp. MM5482-R1]|uniref:putative quinol monooxygenase n=1 Tax=unclassified Paraburkholderia TaxID=2615204 RepID=UPI003D2359E6
MIVILANLKIKLETSEAFVSTARQLVDASRAEPGCMGYELLKGDAETSYSFLERCRDEEGGAAHRKSDHYRVLGRKLGDYIDGKPET